MVNVISMLYEKSETCIAQGDNVRKSRNKGFREFKGGNGTYRMVKSSRSILTYDVDGEIKQENVRSLICEAYGITRVSENKANQFFDDVQKGAIKLDYTDGELKLM